ncbi:MAG: DUF3891 domain-containing protein [Virgibacillus proomii]
MIVRAHKNGYILIEQDHHAQTSGDMIKKWKEIHFPKSEHKASVIYAIDKHDIGWKPFDQEPFWNDLAEKPYSFIDFPNSAKTMLYASGIDQVEAVDSYAGLLCSVHYTRFLKGDASPISRKFVKQEKQRQQRIIQMAGNFDSELFAKYYSLLQLCDNLSLFICLNEPGTDQHPFFKEGIPLPANLESFTGEKINLTWKDKTTVALSDFPFVSEVSFSYPYKWLATESIVGKGLIPAYQQAPFRETTISFVPH